MSSRLLKNVLGFRQYNRAVRQLYLQSTAKSYATIGNQKLQINKNLFITNVCYKPWQIKSFATQTAEGSENIKNADSLLSSIVSSYKNNGYVHQDQCEKLLKQLELEGEQINELLTTENIQFLLHVLGTQLPAKSPEERMQLFQTLWSLLKERSLLTKDLYFQQLQVLQFNQAPLGDLQTFLKEIAVIDENATSSTELFNELLNVACSHGDMTQATEILTAMKDRKFALNERNFNALILGYGRNQDLKGCQTTVDGMQAAGVPLTNETRTALIIVFLENKETSKALDLFNKYLGEFTSDQILKMLRTSILVHLDADVIKALVRGLPSEYTNGQDLSLGLRQLCSELIYKGKFQTVKDIVSALPKPIFSDNQSIDTYATTTMIELFRAQIEAEEILHFAKFLKESEKNTRALHVVTELAMRRSPPTSLTFLEALAQIEPLRPHYFWPLLNYNFRRHGESGILNTLNQMQRLNVSCDVETLNNYVLPHLSITLENPQQGVKMLIAAGIKPSQLIAPLLRHLISQQKLLESIQILELYSTTKIDILGQLMTALSQLSVNVRATKRYQHFAKLLMELSNHNESPKTDFVGQLLSDMLSRQERLRNNLSSFLRFLNEIEKIGLHISFPAANNIESTLNNLKNQRENGSDFKKEEDILLKIKQMLHRMKQRDLTLSQNASNGQNSNASFARHPRDMSLEELECHLIELESKGMNTRGVLRRLLQLYVRENQLEKALEVKEKCEKLRMDISAGMMASIFDLHMKVGDLPKAKEVLEKLQTHFPGFQVDEHKFIDYAALLVLNNQLSPAMDLLAERSSKQRITGGNYVLKNVWNFLTNVAHYAAAQNPPLPNDKNLTREMFDFLRKNGYCQPHNAVLGPIVREYILRGDIEAAIKEFRQLAEHYKHTPLQFELLSLLVRLCNGDSKEIERFPITNEEAQKLLGEVTGIVTKVHGPTNMNSALVLAFAESGTDNQLRRLLINPEFRINHELLQKNCEHLGKEGAVTTLLRLAKGARGFSRAVNEQTIYNMLLKNFIQTNDYAAALDLYERLEADDDLKISSEFLKNLVNLLKMNKINVPSNIALRAHVF